MKSEPKFKAGDLVRIAASTSQWNGCDALVIGYTPIGAVKVTVPDGNKLSFGENELELSKQGNKEQSELSTLRSQLEKAQDKLNRIIVEHHKWRTSDEDSGAVMERVALIAKGEVGEQPSCIPILELDGVREALERIADNYCCCTSECNCAGNMQMIAQSAIKTLEGVRG